MIILLPPGWCHLNISLYLHVENLGNMKKQPFIILQIESLDIFMEKIDLGHGGH